MQPSNKIMGKPPNKWVAFGCHIIQKESDVLLLWFDNPVEPNLCM